MSNTIELLIMHHENMRILYPDDDLMVLCECDGSIYDTRALALHVLRSFDQAYGTRFFKNLTVDHLPLPLRDIDQLLCKLVVPIGISSEIAAWYSRHLWDMDGIWYAHRPLSNVMKVLKCLQLQERTHIGLCAERSGRTVEEFAATINTLGRESGMNANSETIFLDDTSSDKKASERIIRAWRHFLYKGYRLIAIIDSRADAEPGQIFSIDRHMEVLILQTGAVREMQRIHVEPQLLGSPDFMLWDMLNSKTRSHVVPGRQRMHAA